MASTLATPPEVHPERFLELSGTLLAVADFDSVIRWTSSSFPRNLGFSPEQLVGHSFFDFVHPEDREATLRQFERLLGGEDIAGFEWRMRAGDGSYRSLLWSAIGVLDEGLVYGSAQDLTELHAAERRFEAAFAHAALPGVIATAREAERGLIRAANPAAARFTGFSHEELLGRYMQSLMHPEDLDEILEQVGRLLAGDTRSFTLDARYVGADGRVRWGEQSMSLIRDAAGEPDLCVIQIKDLGELREAEQDVRAAEQRFERVFANAPIGMALQDADGRYVQVNAALCEILDRPPEDVVGVSWLDVVHPDDVDFRARERLLTGETNVEHHDKRFRRGDGTWVDARVAVSVIRDENGGVTYFVLQIEDVTDRRRVERVVRESRERLQAIVDGMPANVWVTDLDGRFELVNERVARYLGLHPREIVGRRGFDLFPDEMVEPFQHLNAEALAAQGPVSTEVTIPDGQGGETVFLLHKFALRDQHGEARSIGGTATDITDRVRADEERRQLEASAQQAQRLESVGRLAGGIAHDFNNLLSVILNNASLAADSLPEGAAPRSDLDEVVSAAERAADLTHQLVLFSRRQVAEPEVLSPNKVARRAERLLRRTIGEDVDLRIELSDRVPAVEIDPGQLDRVLLNLAVNARDAMPEGGRLEITTDRAEVDGRPHACVAVRDTGVGMSPEVAERAFEPFFTTKDASGGTGLGLATVYGIVTQAGGRVELESSPGGGSTVSILLPAADLEPPAPEPPAPLESGGRGETVLVVEDEEAVRRLAVRLLEGAGYDVLEAAGLADAVDACDGGERNIDLLVTDVVMPGASGPELAERLREVQSGMAVLFMSGYGEDVLRRHGVSGWEAPLVTKPFTRDSLLRAVGDAIAERDRRG